MFQLMQILLELSVLLSHSGLFGLLDEPGLSGFDMPYLIVFALIGVFLYNICLQTWAKRSRNLFEQSKYHDRNAYMPHNPHRHLLIKKIKLLKKIPEYDG